MKDGTAVPPPDPHARRFRLFWCRTMPRIVPSLLMVAVAFTPAARPADPPARKMDFARDVRPILADTCFACHGPDEKTRKADLRLDTKDGLLSSSSVVPGKPGESELIARVTTHDAAELMPPPKSGRKLTPTAGRHAPGVGGAGRGVVVALGVHAPDPARSPGQPRPAGPPRGSATRLMRSFSPGWKPPV